MVTIERERERLSSELTSEVLERRRRAGWHAAVVEWEREVEPPRTQPRQDSVLELSSAGSEQLPFGTSVAEDGKSLVPDETEMDVLEMVMALVVDDTSLGDVATALNRAGHRTRSGEKFRQVDVFQLLPRVVELGPSIFRSAAWSDRRAELRLA